MELPEELILEILQCTWENDRSSFENLAATCKLIRRISRHHFLTDCFKCHICDSLETALKMDHLTCYKWHYNKIKKPKVNSLCIDASEHGSLKMIVYLVSLGANIYTYEYYILVRAAENGHIDIVQYMVSLGANIHVSNDAPMLSASYHGHLHMVQYLVSLGANIHAHDDYAIEAASLNGHLDMVKYFVSLGISDDKIQCALKTSHPKVSNYLASLVPVDLSNLSTEEVC